MSDFFKKLFMEKNELILIGLTGRTGSGCTTAASILSAPKIEPPKEKALKDEERMFNSEHDIQRYRILSSYLKNNWKHFYKIGISDLIASFIFIADEDLASQFISEYSNYGSQSDEKKISTEDALEILVKSKKSINNSERVTSVVNKILGYNDENLLPDELEKLTNSLISIRKFNRSIKSNLKGLAPGQYVSIFQAAGNSIRRDGGINVNFKNVDVTSDSVAILPEAINRLVKYIRIYHKKYKEGRCCIVIDAIRNPYEAEFFRTRYSSFYLVSINAPDEDRKAYLRQRRKFSDEQLKKLDLLESGKTGNGALDAHLGQNIKRCIEISDVHIFNPRKELHNHQIMTSQLVWYICLMAHPGLVTPRREERVMQTAYTAKLNSGCISRQVGAVVVDNDYSIKAVGWNDVPKGQTPCQLRGIDRLLNYDDPKDYSDYEKNDEQFRSEATKYSDNKIHIKNLYSLNASYCFKDLKNSFENKGNQVHTRALHAEENAFLQLSKYPAGGIKGGILFTTASPCELCAKKAYQLGISDVFFIDPYPGISQSHIFSSGNNSPKLRQFYGAVGQAYHRLYEQVVPYKDELEFYEN